MKNIKERVEFRYYEVEKNFPVIALLGERWEVLYGTDPMHFHNCMEIGYCYNGSGEMWCGKDRLPYQNRTVTVIPRNFPHRTSGNGDEIQKWEYLYIDTEQIFQVVFKNRQSWTDGMKRRLQSRCMAIDYEKQPEISLLVRLILDEMRTKKTVYKDSVKGCLVSLFMYIARLNNSGPVYEKDIPAETVFETFRKSLDFIDRHYMDDISVNQLIEISNMSESHYRRKFREYMNTSPAEYINLVRIDHACELLHNTTERIENIAVATGFQTTGTMIRNFKKMLGMSPGEWRKKAREGQANLLNYRISILKGW